MNILYKGDKDNNNNNNNNNNNVRVNHIGHIVGLYISAADAILQVYLYQIFYFGNICPIRVRHSVVCSEC